MSEENNAGTEVQGEDTAAVLAALSGDKTYLPEPDDKAPVEATTAEAAQAPEAETGEQAAAREEAKRQERRQSYQERINEKTRLHREAERQVESERQAREAAQRDAAYWRQVATGQVQTEDATDDGHGPLTAEQLDQLIEERIEQREARRNAAEAEATFQERVADSAAKHDDYFEVVIQGGEANLWACTAAMNEALRTSEHGPEVAYHLAKNPAESRRIAALSLVAQVRELAILETRLIAPPPAAPTPPRTATEAPEPPPQARGAGGKFEVAADTDDFAAFERRHMPGR